MRDGVARIRGAGVVCSLGTGGAAVLAAASDPAPRAAYDAPFDGARDLPRGLGRRLGRQLAMSLAASLEASGERAWAEEPSDTGIVAATAHGPVQETVEFVASALRDGPRYASPTLFSGSQHNAMTGVAARELGVRGPAMVATNGDVSFETALLTALTWLAQGRMRRALVVGADAHHPVHTRSLARVGVLCAAGEARDPAAGRTGRGYRLGEGAGALLLEWGPRDGAGPWVDEARLGASLARPGRTPARLGVLTSGDARCVRRHDDAVRALGVGGVPRDYPVARFGAFASLSAVAIAVEAARRLASPRDDGPTLFVAAPRDTCAAQVVLAGAGRP